MIINAITTAAIIQKGDQYLLACRAQGERAGLWEFPGGKCEPGEIPQESLVREIREEFGVDAIIGRLLHTFSFNNKTTHYFLFAYQALISSEELILTEHSRAQWFTLQQMKSETLVDSDQKLLQALEKILVEEEQ